MKKLFLIILIMAFIAIPLLNATPTVITPHKLAFSATTVYWGAIRFHDSQYTDTLTFAKSRGFKTAGDSTAVFISGMTTTGILQSYVLNDSSFVISSSVITDSSKTFWYLLIRK